jgi:hypothetical protein
MQSSLVGRVVLGIAVVAAAVVLLVVLSDSESEEGDEATVPTIVVEGGKPVGGVEELVFSAGDRVRFAVRSDTRDEVHIHGYDIEKEIGPGEVARFDFPATIEGVIEAELHESGEQIAELRIEP